MRFIIYLFAFMPLKVFCQNTFNHQYDLNFPFELFTSVLPTDSGYYVTGVVTDTTNQSYRIGNVFLKLDSNGVILFEKSLLSNETWYETWYGDLIKTSNGDFFDIGLAKDSTTKILLVRFDSNGDTLYTRKYFHPLYPDESFLYTAELLIQNSNSFFILSGIDTDPNGTNGDVYLQKLDSLGEVLDVFIYGGPEVQVPMSMVFDENEQIIIGSSKTNRGQVSKNFFSRTHIFKVDSLGNVTGEFLSPANQLFDTARDMVVTPDGGLVVASGKGKEYPINSSSSQLRWSPYILKLNPALGFEWGIEIRGRRQSTESSFVKIVAASDNSGYIATGRIDEDVSTGTQVIGSWVVKVSPQGDSLWARYYSLFDDIKVAPRPFDLKNTPDGGYVIVGDTSPELPGMTVQRAWIMKLDSQGCLIPGCHENDTVTASVDLPVNTSIDLAIYPNPASDYLNFQLRPAPAGQPLSFTITNAAGQVVRSFHSDIPEATQIVPVSDWPAGVYYLQVYSEGRRVGSKAFLVER